MPHRPSVAPAWIAAAIRALVLLVLAAATAVPAQAQRTSGSIGVSLTILPPVATQAVSVTGFHVRRDGTALFRTTSPVTGAVAQLVMARVSASRAAAADRPAADPIVGTGHESGSQRVEDSMTYRVDLGRIADRDASHDVQVRIEYLAVAGT